MSLLDPLKSAQSNISQLNSVKDSLTLGIKNSKVTEFASLVESHISGTNVVTTVTEGIHNIGLPIQKVSEFSTAVYDTALKLSEAKTVAFNFVNDLSHQRGTFDGGKLYKDFTGTVDKASSAVKSVSGWFSFNNSSFDFANIKNGTELLNIGLSETSFKPDLVVKDFTPLYDKLKEVKYNKDFSIIDDTKDLLSRAATNIFKVSLDILSNLFSNNSTTQAVDSIYDSNHRFGRGVYPAQIKPDRCKDVVNRSVYNSVQAVIYDLPECNSTKDISTIDSSIHQLLCFQQPETVSYTASSQYDSVSPRGSQIPLQFYQVANAMSLSFELKWHIDEIRTLRKPDGKTAYTIQEIAQIAEDFTRPWENGNSLTPKVCKVILPGISHIGYITEAQISYSGDMSGDYTTGSGIFGNNGISEADNIQTTGSSDTGNVTHYFYSQLSVTFSMLIIKDVKLIPSDGGKGLKITLVPDKQVTESKNGKEKATENNDVPKADDIPQDEVKATENNSANTETPTDNKEVQEVVKTPEKPATENSTPKKSSSKSSKRKSKDTSTSTEEKNLEPNMSRIGNASFEDSPPQTSSISSTGEQVSGYNNGWMSMNSNNASRDYSQYYSSNQYACGKQ